MKTALKFTAFAFALALAPALSTAAWAEGKSGQQHGKKPQKVEQQHAGKGEKKGWPKVEEEETTHGPVVIHTAGPKDCPPGLAKKNNGCLPPGQAKKLYGSQSTTPYVGRYHIGDRFDESVPYYILRRNEYDRYGVPPFEGQYYVRTENELLRVDRKTDAVIDIITGVTELLNN